MFGKVIESPLVAQYIMLPPGERGTIVVSIKRASSRYPVLHSNRTLLQMEIIPSKIMSLRLSSWECKSLSH